MRSKWLEAKRRRGSINEFIVYFHPIHSIPLFQPVHLVPWISENWQSHFKWRGSGAFPDVERNKLLDILDKAHSQGRMVRFWSIPNRPEFWEEIYVSGVDLINADDLSGLKSFLLKKKN